MINSSVYRDLTYWKVTNYVYKQLLAGYTIKYSLGGHGFHYWDRGKHGSPRFVTIEHIINSETGFDA